MESTGDSTGASTGPLRNAGNNAGFPQAVLETIATPLLVLDKDLRVAAANQFFHVAFHTKRPEILGRSIYALDDGRWNIPELRSLLDKVLLRSFPPEAHEVERDMAGNAPCTLLFNARPVFDADDDDCTILLAVRDVTDERAREREVRKMLQQKDVLLQEMQHRIANSLQIIASILLMQARSVQSEETRLHLQGAHGRVISIFAVQKQLQVSQNGGRVELGPYLSHLCASLADAMIGETRPIALKVSVENGWTSSSVAVSLGLIVTELVINALKHAFGQNDGDGEIKVSYAAGETGWRLCVSDNGTGKFGGAAQECEPGLGMSIVESLASQLGSRVNVASDARGYRTTIANGVFDAGLANAVWD